MVNKTLGCVFCDMTGCVSATNQHVRSFHQAITLGRKSRTRNFHHTDISHAFEHLHRAQPALVNTVSPERLAVLTAFANLATRELTPDEVAAWSRRDYQLHGTDWWDRAVDAAVRMYRASGYDDDLLAMHVKRVVDESIEDCYYTPPAPLRPPMAPAAVSRTATGTSAKGGSGLVTISGGGGSNLTMQGSGSNHRYKHGNRSTACSIGQGDSIDRRTYISISDEDHGDDGDDDDDDLYAPAPPKSLYVTKRGPTTTSARAVSAGNVRPQPTLSTRAVSAGATFPSADKPLPFLTLQVCGLNNRVNVVEIDFGTTLAEAVAKAVEHAPLALRRLGVRAFAFEGTAEGVWAGMWPEWRWKQLMENAESEELVVQLRLVCVA